MNETFSHKARRAVENYYRQGANGAADETKAALAYEAMMDISNAEESARATAQRLRDRADDIERNLDGHSYMDQGGIGSLGEDINRALAGRQMAFKILARLFTQDQIKNLMAHGSLDAPADGGETR